MNKMEYLERLESCLKWKIPKVEVDDIMRDYAEYFEEGRRQSKTDFEISAKLGNPEIVAEQIIEESRQQRGDRDYRKTMKRERKERGRKEREEKELEDELKQVKGWFSRLIRFLKRGFCSIGRGIVSVCRFFLGLGLAFFSFFAAAACFAALLAVLAFGGAGLLFAIVLLILSGFGFFWVSIWTGVAAAAAAVAAASVGGLLIAFGLFQWKKLWAFLKRLAIHMLEWIFGISWAGNLDFQRKQTENEMPKGKKKQNRSEQNPQDGPLERNGEEQKEPQAENNLQSGGWKAEAPEQPVLTLQKGQEAAENSDSEKINFPVQPEPEGEKNIYSSPEEITEQVSPALELTEGPKPEEGDEQGPAIHLTKPEPEGEKNIYSSPEEITGQGSPVLELTEGLNTERPKPEEGENQKPALELAKPEPENEEGSNRKNLPGQVDSSMQASQGEQEKPKQEGMQERFAASLIGGETGTDRIPPQLKKGDEENA